MFIKSKKNFFSSSPYWIEKMLSAKAKSYDSQLCNSIRPSNAFSTVAEVERQGLKNKSSHLQCHLTVYKVQG